MNPNPWYVVGGFAAVAAVALGLVSAYTFAFYKILKKKLERPWTVLAFITVIWLVVTMATVMFLATYGTLIFSLALVGFFAVTGFLVAYKVLKLDLLRAIFYAVGFSGIINPVWYFIF